MAIADIVFAPEEVTACFEIPLGSAPDTVPSSGKSLIATVSDIHTQVRNNFALIAATSS